MKVLIVAGSPWSNLENVFSILERTGVTAAKPADKRSDASIHSWHRRLLGGAERKSIKSLQIPGKAWEQAAGEIFLANWDDEMWGWSDFRSTLLLDFWGEFDPQICFILAVAKPEKALIRAIEAGVDPDAESILETWLTYNREALRFFNRNPGRCLLVDADDVLSNCEGFIERCNGAFDLTLKFEGYEGGSPVDRFAPLAFLLEKNLLQVRPEVAELWQEIQASLIRCTDHVVGVARSTPVDFSQAVKCLNDLMVIAGPRIEELENQLQELRCDNIALVAEVADFKAKYLGAEAEKARYVQLVEQLRQDSESLLLEYRQTQEQVEAYFSQCQELEHSRSELSARCLEAEAALQARDASLQQERLNLQARVEDAQAEIVRQEQLVQQLRDNSELLLLEYRQTQEQVESYFVQCQELEQDVKDHRQRWQRLQSRYPDYADWRSIELLSQSEDSARPVGRWRIQGLVAGDRVIPEFECIAMVLAGVPSLLFHCPDLDQANSPFLRWPLSARGKSTVTIQPAMTGSRSKNREPLEVLTNLASSDWSMVISVCSALVAYLQTTQGARIPIAPSPAFWIDHLKLLRSQLRQIPPVWRYDRVSLVRQLAEPKLERLWLRLENVEFGSRKWPEFEFRLSASELKPGQFTTHPKLEFPLLKEGHKQFENWYPESADQFGAKFELRFATERAEMDLAVWNRLSQLDQKQLIAIVLALPNLLNMLELQGVQSNRPWNDWRQLAGEIMRVVAHKLAQSQPKEDKSVKAPEIPPPISSQTNLAKHPAAKKGRASAKRKAVR